MSTSKKKEAALVMAAFLAIIGSFVMMHYGTKSDFETQWNQAEVIFEDGVRICKEMTYCQPCVPVRHEYRGTFCRNKWDK